MYWIIIGVKLTYYVPQAILKHVVSRGFIVENLVHVTSSVGHIQIA